MYADNKYETKVIENQGVKAENAADEDATKGEERDKVDVKVDNEKKLRL